MLPNLHLGFSEHTSQSLSSRWGHMTASGQWTVSRNDMCLWGKVREKFLCVFSTLSVSQYIVFPGLLWQTEWLKQQKLFTVLEARSLRSRCWQGHAPSEGAGKDLFQASPLLSGSSSAYGSITANLHMAFSLCACPSVQNFPFLERYQSYWYRVHLMTSF